MQLLLCASTEFEIRPVIDFIDTQNTSSITVLITGVGMMATTYSLTRAIYSHRPDFIIQAGVGGCLDKRLPLSKVVFVENESLGDVGVEENGIFKNLFDLRLLDRNTFPWRDGKLSNDVERLRSTGLTIVDAVTVNEITTNGDRIDHYRKQLNASVESMEGAALHFIALLENIPFLQMRSLSNFVGERDKSKWVMDIAIANLNIELERTLSKLLNQ
jgi:futalosine hydrolase